METVSEDQVTTEDKQVQDTNADKKLPNPEGTTLSTGVDALQVTSMKSSGALEDGTVKVKSSFASKLD